MRISGGCAPNKTRDQVNNPAVMTLFAHILRVEMCTVGTPFHIPLHRAELVDEEVLEASCDHVLVSFFSPSAGLSPSSAVGVAAATADSAVSSESLCSIAS
jgi:hypothetical protein